MPSATNTRALMLIQRRSTIRVSWWSTPSETPAWICTNRRWASSSPCSRSISRSAASWRSSAPRRSPQSTGSPTWGLQRGSSRREPRPQTLRRRKVGKRKAQHTSDTSDRGYTFSQMLLFSAGFSGLSSSAGGISHQHIRNAIHSAVLALNIISSVLM